MNLVTLRYRIKDGSSRSKLVKMANSVNFVFNYCNQSNLESWKKFRKTLSAFDLNKLTSGCSADLGLNSQTIQAVCESYCKSYKQHKKVKLKWRSSKRSLGWIPFKSSGISIKNDSVVYFGNNFKIWLSRPIIGKVRLGSFNEDSRGRWYVNLVIEKEIQPRVETGKSCGIDLGLKTLITLSDGTSFTRNNITVKYQNKLAIAQRAKKKKLVANIHSKIKNQRKDWNHKVSTLITNQYNQIIIGNVNSVKLSKTRMAKSVADTGWSDFKTMLKYKAIALGCVVKEVNESWTTVTCSNCKERSGPKGLAGLSVREWRCEFCDSIHDRDVNAAKNILHLGHQMLLKESISF